MTFDECCGLPNRTEVHLADGRRGRIVVWHKAAESVGIAIDGAVAPLTVKCADLERQGDGRVVLRAA